MYEEGISGNYFGPGKSLEVDEYDKKENKIQSHGVPRAFVMWGGMGELKIGVVEMEGRKMLEAILVQHHACTK